MLLSHPVSFVVVLLFFVLLLCQCFVFFCLFVLHDGIKTLMEQGAFVKTKKQNNI